MQRDKMREEDSNKNEEFVKKVADLALGKESSLGQNNVK